MSVPTPEQIVSEATGPRRAIMEIALSDMSSHECTLFFSLLAASFAARELGPPPTRYSEMPMGALRPIKVKPDKEDDG